MRKQRVAILTIYSLSCFRSSLWSMLFPAKLHTVPTQLHRACSVDWMVESGATAWIDRELIKKDVRTERNKSSAHNNSCKKTSQKAKETDRGHCKSWDEVGK